MSPELTEKLFAAFPRLYRGRYKTMYESSMCWGFECGDGWYQLVYDLSLELSNYLAEHPELDFEATQVKSKFGYLRFHLSGRDEVTEKLIEQACEQASVTCELTGKPGRFYRNSTHRFAAMVLCPEKASELGLNVLDDHPTTSSDTL